MTSTPSEPRLYDVWLMWVEFPDHPGIGKPRPVVITEVDGDLVSGIVAKITGNTDWDEDKGLVNIKDYLTGLDGFDIVYDRNDDYPQIKADDMARLWEIVNNDETLRVLAPVDWN